MAALLGGEIPAPLSDLGMHLRRSFQVLETDAVWNTFSAAPIMLWLFEQRIGLALFCQENRTFAERALAAQNAHWYPHWRADDPPQGLGEASACSRLNDFETNLLHHQSHLFKGDGRNMSLKPLVFLSEAP